MFHLIVILCMTRFSQSALTDEELRDQIEEKIDSSMLPVNSDMMQSSEVCYGILVAVMVWAIISFGFSCIYFVRRNKNEVQQTVADQPER